MNDTIYQAWHRNLGHTEYRLRITMEGYGSDPDAADAFLEGFLNAHPEAGAVISQDAAEDTITATFSLAANSEHHAVQLGVTFWIESGARSGLEPGDVVRVAIEPLELDQRDPIIESVGPKVPA